VPLIELMRQTEHAGTFVTSYPLSRTRRVEFQGGMSRLGFDRYTARPDGEIEWTKAADTLTLGHGSAAFVSDTASFGPMSALRGTRYRLEAAPTFGTTRYLHVLADYRRYFMPVRFYTIAARGLHVGRYGRGADDPRLPPLYVGYPTLVRGYDLDSRIVEQCVAPLATTCDGVDRMLGSRLAVANVELRFPLLRPLGMSSRMYGPLPVETAVFVDGGVAWRADQGITTVASNGVWSAGITFRVSVLGLGLGQFDIARPFRSALPGWVFQFNLAPAF
jgi:outer membrane protein assembly factor BamA